MENVMFAAFSWGYQAFVPFEPATGYGWTREMAKADLERQVAERERVQ